MNTKKYHSNLVPCRCELCITSATPCGRLIDIRTWNKHKARHTTLAESVHATAHGVHIVEFSTAVEEGQNIVGPSNVAEEEENIVQHSHIAEVQRNIDQLCTATVDEEFTIGSDDVSADEEAITMEDFTMDNTEDFTIDNTKDSTIDNTEDFTIDNILMEENAVENSSAWNTTIEEQRISIGNTEAHEWSPYEFEDISHDGGYGDRDERGDDPSDDEEDEGGDVRRGGSTDVEMDEGMGSGMDEGGIGIAGEGSGISMDGGGEMAP